MSGAGLGSAATPNFAALRERSRKELTECITAVRGPKALVLDPSLRWIDAQYTHTHIHTYACTRTHTHTQGTCRRVL